MPTNIQSLSKILEQESSVLRLPGELQLSALRILESIHRHRLKHIQLRATELRNEARMDTHRFHLLFNWLQQHGYCVVTKTKPSVTGTKGRMKGRPRRSWAKLVDITTAGEVVLRKRRRLGHLGEIAKELYRARSPAQEMKVTLDLIVEAFDLAYSEFYHAGKTEDFERFRGGLEEHLREHLDNEIGDQMGLIHNVYLSIRTVPAIRLLEDAKRARERGHFLTQNHRYILHRMEHVQEKELLDHNVRWRDNVMNTKFSGSESPQDFEALINPWKIVERESEERGIRQADMITFTRDSYDLNKLWELDVHPLEDRWIQARSEYTRRYFAPMSSARQE